MAPNPCCCCSLEEASMWVAGWSTFYSVAQLVIFTWQTLAISYERDRAADVPIANFDMYGRPDTPYSFPTGWLTLRGRYYLALFLIQFACLAISLALLFASMGLFFGIRKWSRSWVWPWLLVMPLSILSTLAYCITWWAGYIRGYWLVLTSIEFLLLLLNIYCWIAIAVFYRQINAQLRYYEQQKWWRARERQEAENRHNRFGNVLPQSNNNIQPYRLPRLGVNRAQEAIYINNAVT